MRKEKDNPRDVDNIPQAHKTDERDATPVGVASLSVSFNQWFLRLVWHAETPQGHFDGPRLSDLENPRLTIEHNPILVSAPPYGLPP